MRPPTTEDLDKNQRFGSSAAYSFSLLLAGSALARVEVIMSRLRSMLVGVAALGAVLAPTSSFAETGVVRLRVVNAGFIVGAGGGEGTLRYRGRLYPVSVGGVGIGVFGAAASDLVGRAYNLRRPSDIAGAYTVVGVGAAIGGGARATRLQNANGVVLDLQGVQVGLEVSASLSGVTIAMR
jgi:hypothetical protein